MKTVGENALRRVLSSFVSKRRLKRYAGFLIPALVLAGFLYVTGQRLGSVPVPDIADESFTLQVSYEMLNHGKLALPMYRYLGGNIENVWHSYTPAYFIILSGFQKLFGWGLLQGRVLNLIASAMMLLMLYIIGRRLFNWQTATIAVFLMVSDLTFIYRSRIVRNDYAASAFAMLAYYLYELAGQRKSKKVYLASGIAAGVGVMCHTNILYMLGGISLLELLKYGKRIFRNSNLGPFLVGAFAVMSYEIIYDLVDLRNFILQNAGDKTHFGILSSWGWWANVLNETKRYEMWVEGSSMPDYIPRTLLHLFQILTIVSIVYLLTVLFHRIRSGNIAGETAVRVLLVTLSSVFFHAVVTSHKSIHYMAHLAPWFALCVGILTYKAMGAAKRIRFEALSGGTHIRSAAIAVGGAIALSLVYQSYKMNKRYLRYVRSPDHASFEQFKAAARDLVPDGVCPVSAARPVVWLAFPEADRCYVTIESRMSVAADLKEMEYAFFMHPGQLRTWRINTDEYHLLGELKDSPYGSISVFYTGTKEYYRNLPTKRYHFFGLNRGCVSDDQIANALPVWSVDRKTLQGSQKESGQFATEELTVTFPTIDRPDTVVDLFTVDLEPDMIYQLNFETRFASGRWAALPADAVHGTWLSYKGITENERAASTSMLFRTMGTSRIRISLHNTSKGEDDRVSIESISIRAVAPL
jgi:4-amino-4-deoxy-L-arabinose transferase-like glycosyltransferase